VRNSVRPERGVATKSVPKFGTQRSRKRSAPSWGPPKMSLGTLFRAVFAVKPPRAGVDLTQKPAGTLYLWPLSGTLSRGGSGLAGRKAQLFQELPWNFAHSRPAQARNCTIGAP